MNDKNLNSKRLGDTVPDGGRVEPDASATGSLLGPASAGPPLFSILHTSARPDKWRQIYDAWMKAAVNPERVEYVLCVDERWGFRPGFTGYRAKMECTPEQPFGTRFGERTGDRVVWNTKRRCYVDGVNTAAQAATGRILIVNADDQWPCDGWDQQLWAEIRLNYMIADHELLLTRDFVVEVSTNTPSEHERGILVMPILSRARYERLGYVFYPEYESMYADNEFCEHARQDAVVIDARHLVFPHRHPLFDASARVPGKTWRETDEAYAAQNRDEAFTLGKRIFEYRKRIGFGAALDRAEKIQGWMSRAELEWLSRAAYESGSAIEVGCWKGRTTSVLAESCDVVHAVDTWAGSEELPAMQAQAQRENVYEEFLSNTRRFGDRVQVHRGKSHEIAETVPNAGLLLIDGGHTYDQVKADLLAYLGKATHIICGHDWPDPQVRQAVMELIGDVQTVPGTRLWYYRIPKGSQFEVKRRRTIALCLSGETFHGEWLDAFLNLYQYLVDNNWGIWRAREYTSNVYVTREQIRKVMMEVQPGPEYFLWFDDDNPPPTPQQFALLLKDLEERPDVDGVTAWCWIYNKDKGIFYPSCGTWSPDGLHWRPYDVQGFPRKTEPFLGEATGFPCFLLRRSAFEKAGPLPFKPILDDLLDHGVGGEDHAFCQRLQQGGGKFLVEPRVRVRHLKWCDATPDVPDPVCEPKVAVMMRVKNEARWIDRVIKSVVPLAGENIFVMDDESTDDTLEIAKAAGVNVYRDPFAGQPLDETRDKDWLLAQVRDACNPDWVLCIDGDEELEHGGADKILSVLRSNPDVEVFSMRFLFLWNSPAEVRVDGRYSSLVRESLFRPVDGVHFRSYYEVKDQTDAKDPRCHVGLHCGNAPGAQTLRSRSLPVYFLHYGYMLREDRIRKYNWYRSIDPDNPWEDGYRHMVLGDLPELPADLTLPHGGPLRLVKLPPAMVPQFDKMPEPLGEEVTA